MSFSLFLKKNPFSDRLHICSLFLETEEVRQSVSKLSKEVCSLIRQKCCSLKYAQMCFVTVTFTFDQVNLIS